jgi:hypothetical protein
LEDAIDAIECDRVETLDRHDQDVAIAVVRT